MIEPEEVLSFWFGNVRQNPEFFARQKKLWYRSRAETDRIIGTRFGDLLRHAENGQLQSWSETASSRLALIIVLDQFSRHVYRGTSDAFKNDHIALEIAAGFHDYLSLTPIEQVFANHPFKHAENLEHQRLSLQRFQALHRSSAVEWKPIMLDFVQNADRHFQLIERFGRFPHRNALLGRVDTEQERLYLNTNQRRFGQKVKH